MEKVLLDGCFLVEWFLQSEQFRTLFTNLRRFHPHGSITGDESGVPCLEQVWSGFPLDSCCVLCYNLNMRKMFEYRIYPTKKQHTLLNQTLEECRWLYNHLLQKRKEAYAQDGLSLSLYEQQATFPILKTGRPSLATVHSQVVQNVAVRLDLAMQAFFRRVKAHEQEPGFPRFKVKGRYDCLKWLLRWGLMWDSKRLPPSRMGKR